MASLLPKNSPQVPDEIVLDGQRITLAWSLDGGQWVVGCTPVNASSEVVGFGNTVDEAIADLRVAYRDLVLFASTDGVSEWSKLVH